MNKRILALGLAGALAMTSVVIPYSPATLSVEAAYVETYIYHDEDSISLSFPKKVDTTSGEDFTQDFTVGESRSAVISGTVITETINNLNDNTYIDEDDGAFTVEHTDTTYSFYQIKLSDLKDWMSSDEEVATVVNGVVTAKKVGRTDITAEYSYKNENNQDVPVHFEKRIYVVKGVPGDSLVEEKVDLDVGASYTINPAFFKSNINKDEIIFIPLDLDDFGEDAKVDGDVVTGSVATFNLKTGTITAKDLGTIRIGVIAENTEGVVDGALYTFYIRPAVGTTLKDYNNTGKYTILNSKEVAFAGSLNNNAKLVIPGYVWLNGDGYDVVEIADGALEGSNIKSVLIPDSVKKIGARAFKKCKKLKRVDLSSTDVTEIGDEAFADCSKLKEAVLNADKITKIGKKAFKGKKGRKYYIVSSKKKVHKKFVKKLKKAKAKGQFLEQNMAEPEEFEVDERR